MKRLWHSLLFAYHVAKASRHQAHADYHLRKARFHKQACEEQPR